MSRLANILHVGFVVRPDWNLSLPLHPANIKVETLASRQVMQLAGWDSVIAKIQKIVQEELVVAHIMQFRMKLNQVSPGPGYRVDPMTQKSISNDIQLAPTVPTSTMALQTPAHSLLSAPAL